MHPSGSLNSPWLQWMKRVRTIPRRSETRKNLFLKLMFAATSSFIGGTSDREATWSETSAAGSSTGADALVLVLTFGPSWRKLPADGTRRDPSLRGRNGDGGAETQRTGANSQKYLKWDQISEVTNTSGKLLSCPMDLVDIASVLKIHLDVLPVRPRSARRRFRLWKILLFGKAACVGLTAPSLQPRALQHRDGDGQWRNDWDAAEEKLKQRLWGRLCASVLEARH